jgi:hypothetical protein
MAQKYMCRVHEATSNYYQITLRNEKGEIVFVHTYCLQCYDLFLQRHLDLLNPIQEEEEDSQEIFI